MPGNRTLFVLLILAVLGMWRATTVAQTQIPVVLIDTQDQYSLGLHMELLEDKEKQWTIDDVTSSPIANQFVPSLEEAPGFGFTDSAYWVRFQVKNEATEVVEWLLLYETMAFFVDYYFPAEDGSGYEIVNTGSALPFATRDVPAGELVFRLPVAAQETQTVHMRFASDGALILGLSILSAEAFAQQTFTQLLLNGFLYGVLLILAVYNLVLFFYLRDNSYIYYVLYFGTILLAIMSLDGFAAQYLWPNWGSFAAGATRFLMILSFTFALLFTTSFLRTSEYAPRLHKLMTGLAISIVLLLGLQFLWFRQTAVLHIFLMLASCVIMIAAGFVVWRKEYKPARYFLLGWSLGLVGFSIFILSLIDVISFSSSSDVLIRLGLIVLALVLSVGLADRINAYRQQRELAQLAVVTQRTRIAQDLHDSVTQSLYSANLFAEAGRETVQAGDTQGASHYFTRIGAVTQQALKEMRLFLYELRPPDVVEVGLVDALQKRLDAVEKRSGMEARLILDGDIHYADEIGDQYYRIAQEALNNVLKHAQADEVTVYLRAKNGIMGLEVADNGRGFDLMEGRKSGGMGLKTMQERSQQIGGEFDIQTAPNQGTKVLVQVNQNHE